jgi:phosphoglycolate phosphatase-like HAD superfamily hydrolase
MMPAVIFDLDQTVVASRDISALRKARSWSEVYSKVPGLKTYIGISELMKSLNENNIEIIIITVSPSSYCMKVIAHFGWKVTKAICYHDVRPNIKPHPEAFNKAIRDLKLDPTRIISAGDSSMDIIASNRANIPSIACSWDTDNRELLLSASPTYHATSPEELSAIVKRFHGLV